MRLAVVLHMKDIDHLAARVQVTPVVNDLITRALRLRQFAGAEGPHITILCEENEARELLRYAQVQCPDCVEKIRNAFLQNGLTP